MGTIAQEIRARAKNNEILNVTKTEKVHRETSR